jgi:hypothetical protein
MIEYRKYSSLDNRFIEYIDINYIKSRIVIRQYFLYKTFYIRYINSNKFGINLVKYERDV